MTTDERLKAYINGADAETESQTECAMLTDPAVAEQFFALCEREPLSAPPSLAANVLTELTKVTPIPPARFAMSRATRAALCFAGAAIVVFCTLFGFDMRISGAITEAPEKLGAFIELINTLK